MYTVIGIESLAVNALIELSEDKRNGVKISYSQLVDYGFSVLEQYRMESHEEAMLVFDLNDLQSLAADYSYFFGIQDTGEEKFLYLKPNIKNSELKKQFLRKLSCPMLKALSKVKITDVMAG